ncbi:MAG: NAD(P)/FAD-dependent oxidoreductase [Pseudoxanthomonas sp.]
MTLSHRAPYDVVIVGGSFAGLSAALMLGRARKRVLVIDGGRPRNRFADHAHGLIGHDGKPPAQLLGEAVAQVMAYPSVGLHIGLARRAERNADGFLITLDAGESVSGRKLILASGIRDVLPDVEGLAARWGRSVLHCPYCHGYEVAGQPLGVLANSAMSPHQAEVVSEWGPTIYFSQGRFAPDSTQEGRLKALGVQLEHTPVASLHGVGANLQYARLHDGRQIPLAAMFTVPGIELQSDLAAQLGCSLVDGPLGHYVKVDDTRQTSVPGVFAAGDMATAMQSVPLAVAAGAMAGVAAHRALIEDACRDSTR